MRLMEVLNPEVDGIHRKMNALKAIINDRAASDGEKDNARRLLTVLSDKLSAQPASIDDRLMQILSAHGEYCTYAGRYNVGLTWGNLIVVLNRHFGDMCKFYGTSPSRGDYQVSANYNMRTITICYSRGYELVPDINSLIGKLLFVDLKPMLQRMITH